MKAKKSARPYHHGDLAAALRQAARAILEKEGLSALSLRSVARHAGVSHAAPYRHYKSREALLADVATEGLAELRADIALAAAKPGDRGERIVHIGGAYIRFAARHGGLLRLMFGSELPNRAEFPGLAEATATIGDEIGGALGDTASGITAWGAVHGLAMLILENVIDLGQNQGSLDVLPSRAEILLRSLIVALRD
jgi:AcrR family transcriptional regulator